MTSGDGGLSHWDDDVTDRGRSCFRHFDRSQLREVQSEDLEAGIGGQGASLVLVDFTRLLTAIPENASGHQSVRVNQSCCGHDAILSMNENGARLLEPDPQCN